MAPALYESLIMLLMFRFIYAKFPHFEEDISSQLFQGTLNPSYFPIANPHVSRHSSQGIVASSAWQKSTLL